MSNAERAPSPEPLREQYRDELNFAEFPLASVSTSLPKDQKTLEFRDEIFDKARNERITRKLTITASDKYGLPTAIDDEVILGLIQLTGKTDFANRKVHFTRYELLKLLNWADSTKNYNRLEQSLNRWLGVTLYYDKAWWSKEEQSWVDEGFHILDQVTILDKERQRRRAAKGEDGGKSSFVWNEVVFNSFKAGYLKQIDFEFYKGLESAISKRMYRFLDKRFYHRPRLEFDLRTFACEHIGLSKNYHTGELKRVLSPAIAELEVQRFLKTLPGDERFVRKGRGEWTIVFQREAKQLQPSSREDLPELVKALIQRGVTESSARSIVAQLTEEKIREKISFFDWLMARRDHRVSKSPAGFLYRSIVEDFSLPDDYLNAVGPRKTRRPESNVVPLQRHKRLEPQEPPSDRAAIDQFWSELTAAQQEELERELVAAAPLFLRQQYTSGQKERGPLFQVVRQAIIDDYVRRELSKRTSAVG